MFVSRSLVAAAALLALAGLTRPAAAAPQDIILGFGSLPSAQGWTYNSTGVVAPETPTWALSGGTLSYNTMAYLTNTSGTGTTSFYRKLGLISGTETVIFEMRARVLQYESDGSVFSGGGLVMSMGTGATGWQMGITTTQIKTIDNVVIATLDNTQFHTYSMVWSPGPALAFYVDGTLISTHSTGLAGTPNQAAFGDGTGAANAQAEITYFRFRQGSQVTPDEPASWGRIKAAYR